MKITQLETWMANAGLRNYLFVRLRTDSGLTGVGEASLEWQEKTVQTIIHEWVEDRVLGRDPFDIEAVVGAMVRDQYQGGSTVMTAISGVEIALWDIVGKACHQPVYRLLGGRCQRRIPAYANGWYGGASTPAEYAERAREAVAGAPDDRVPRTLVGRQRPGDDSRARAVRAHLVRGTGDGGQSRSAGRGQAADSRTACRRRASLHHCRLLPTDRAACRRCGPDGCRPLRRDPGQQEDRRHGRRTGYADRASLLRRPGRPGCLPARGRQHPQFHGPGGVRRVRRALAQQPRRWLEPDSRRGIHPQR